MEQQSIPSETSLSHLELPEDLVRRLHDATTRLHQSKRHLDAELLSNDYEHEVRLEAVRKELLQAEQEVEEANGRVQEELGRRTREAGRA